jgi:Tfp pilus assembly protein PilV
MRMSMNVRRDRSRSAFSLVEVLIAVVVLALGVLGLAAIFPAVIVQQRSANEQVQSRGVAKVAQAILTRSEAAGSLPWDQLEIDAIFSTGDGIVNTDSMSSQACGKQLFVGLWEPGWDWDKSERQEVSTLLSDAGAVPFYAGRLCSTTTVGGRVIRSLSSINKGRAPLPEELILVRERLVPSVFSGASPQFVWDVVARKTAGRPGLGGLIQAAVFVRRIDPNLRVPAGKGLSELFLPSTAPTVTEPAPRPLRFPVAVDQSGRAVPDDGGSDKRYAAPVSMQVTTGTLDASGASKEIVFNDTAASTVRRDQAAQSGQLLLDNTGVVRKVVRVLLADNGTTRGVEVDPAVSSSEAKSLIQIVFTPQVPADVVMIAP